MNRLEQTCQKIFPQDSQARAEATSRLNHRGGPHWGLGGLMDLAVDLAGMTGTVKPRFARKAVVTMAADHGVSAEGNRDSGFMPEDTPQMIYNLVNGRTAINALATQAGADVFVVDMGVNADFDDLVFSGKIIDKKVGRGSNNSGRGPAMSIARARQAVEAGIEVATSLCKHYDLLGTGDIGRSGSSAGIAIAAVITGKSVEQLTECGSVPDDAQAATEATTVRKILEVNKPDRNNGLDVLSKVGGFEIGGIAGLIIGAAAHRVPVVIDGVLSTAGALIACRIEPFIRDYLVFSQRLAAPGHPFMLEVLGCRKPLLEFGIRIGDGTGAVLAMNLVNAATTVLTGRAPS